MFDPKKVPNDLGNYLTGFADAEGSLHVSIRKKKDYKIPLKISLCFNLSQKEKEILSQFKKHLQCGTIRKRKHDSVYYYEVNSFNDIQTNLIPFFNRFSFLSAKKKRDFSKFKKLAKLIQKKDHLTCEGIKEILKIRKEMNDGGKRKYSDQEILRILRDYTPNAESEDRVRPSWKHGELVRNESVITKKRESNKLNGPKVNLLP